MTHSWLACSSRDGRVIAELPGLDVPTIGVTLCDWWTGQASLLLDESTAQDWRRATAPWASYLVCIDDGQADPIWGGWVTQRTSTSGDSISLGIASWEAYLARRYVRDLIYPDSEQCGLLAHLVGQCVLAPIPGAPVPPALLVEHVAGSTTRHREYELASQKTVASVMQELSGVEGGPEWTVTWRHLPSPERYLPVLTIRDRIGQPKPVGMPSAAALFALPGSVLDFSRSEDWTDGRGANCITATSTADGADLPMSAVQVYADPDRPSLEYRYTPSSSITDIGTLRSHAARARDVMKDGAAALALTAAAEAAPRLGADWGLGDDIGWSLACRSISPGRRIPGDPGSDWLPVEGTDRCIGWEATLTGVRTVTPILKSTEVW
ncbi:MAG: hypothetical protein QM804_10360 [Propionicimonas sp.]